MSDESYSVLATALKWANILAFGGKCCISDEVDAQGVPKFPKKVPKNSDCPAGFLAVHEKACEKAYKKFMLNSETCGGGHKCPTI